MNSDQLINGKRLRNKENAENIFEYLYGLREEYLDVNTSLPPELEDEIRIQLSKLSYEDSESLINNFIYPGIKILIDHPNALIGDAIVIIISLKTIKNVLYTNRNLQSKIINVLTLQKCENLEPKPICNHICVLNCLTESRFILENMSSYMKEFIALIFKKLKNGTYHLQKSSVKLISSIVKMEILNSLIMKEFFSFQEDLYNQIMKGTELEIKDFEFYKYIINEKDLRNLLFKNDYMLMNNQIKSKTSEEIILYLDSDSKFNNFQIFLYKLLPKILFNKNQYISYCGLDLFNTVISDHEFIDSFIISDFLTEIRNSINLSIKVLLSNKIIKELNKELITQIKILNIVIENEKCKYFIEADLIIMILEFTTFIMKSCLENKGNKSFFSNGILNILLNTASSFKLFGNNIENQNNKSRISIVNSLFLSQSEHKIIYQYSSLIFKMIKLTLINFSEISDLFQITEPQIINYIIKILNSNLNYMMIDHQIYKDQIIFNQELISIYEKSKLNNWNLFFLLKCFISLHSNEYQQLFPCELYEKIINILEEIIFTENCQKNNSKSSIQIKKYGILSPNIILTSCELLVIFFKKTGINKIVFNKSLQIFNKFMKSCLNFKYPTFFNSKNEVNYEDHIEFFTYMIELIRNIRFDPKFNVQFDLSLIQDIFEFSNNGLSTNMLNAIFYLLNIIIHHNSENIEINFIEDLIQKLLLYYVPDEEVNAYQTLYNTFKKVCDSRKMPCNLISPQIKENISKKDEYSRYHFSSENIQIKHIINRFNECTIDCVGE